MKQKKTTPNPYATLRGGRIRAPHDTAKDQPKATSIKTTGGDLRTKRG